MPADHLRVSLVRHCFLVSLCLAATWTFTLAGNAADKLRIICNTRISCIISMQAGTSSRSRLSLIGKSASGTFWRTCKSSWAPCPMLPSAIPLEIQQVEEVRVGDLIRRKLTYQTEANKTGLEHFSLFPRQAKANAARPSSAFTRPPQSAKGNPRDSGQIPICIMPLHLARTATSPSRRTTLHSVSTRTTSTRNSDTERDDESDLGQHAGRPYSGKADPSGRSGADRLHRTFSGRA